MSSGKITAKEALLSRLLALNLERVAKQGEVQPALLEGEPAEDE